MRRLNEIEEAALRIQRFCKANTRCTTCCLHNHNKDCCFCDGATPDMWKLPVEEKTFEQTEVCPHCDSEVSLIWDVDTKGYQVFCPDCGNKIMLCDACLHADDNPDGFCDWKIDFNGNPSCHRTKNTSK